MEDIIIIELRTIMCGGEDYADMKAFGVEREDFLRKFLELPNGIPHSDFREKQIIVKEITRHE